MTHLRRPHRRTLQAAAVAALAAAALWGISDWPSADKENLAPAPAVVKSAPSWFSTLGAPTASLSTRNDPVPALLSLARQVDALIATGKPEDAYTAHQLISDCIAFQRLGVMPYFLSLERREMSQAEQQSAASVCASLNEPIRRARIDYLTLAAKAGVPGASSEFLMEGPFGDPSALETRPDDPLVLQWKQQAIEQLKRDAEQGDLSSLSTLWIRHMSGTPVFAKDARLAYTYNAAMERIFRMQAPDAAGGPYAAELFSFLKDGLTPEQIAAADAEAGRIADNFRQRVEAKMQAAAAAAAATR